MGESVMEKENTNIFKILKISLILISKEGWAVSLKSFESFYIYIRATINGFAYDYKWRRNI